MSVQDKVILVTGSTDGIGMETAYRLARQGARVIVHGRNPARGRAVRDEIRRATDNHAVDLLIADLASQAQVRELAQEVQVRYERLDVLVNNAGVYEKRRRLTEDGIEMTLAVNHLAPFLLTHLLLDLVRASAPARIVNVSSRTHESVREVDFDNLQGERSYDGYHAYALSKLGNILLTYDLADRLDASEVTANTLHPGAVNTKLLRAGFGSYGSTPEQGAETPVYLASSPEVEHVTGKYFIDKRPVASSPLSFDERLRKELIRVSQVLTGLTDERSDHERIDSAVQSTGKRARSGPRGYGNL